MSRIAICSSGIPHESQGASAVLFFHYIARLRREGHELRHVLLLEGDGFPDRDVAAYRDKLGIEVVPCRAPSFFQRGRWRHRLNITAATAVRDGVEGFRPDLLVCFDFLPAWILENHVGPRLIWLGDLAFETVWWHAIYAAREDWRGAIHLPGNWLGCRAWRRLYARVLAGANEVIVASHSSVAKLAEIGVAAEYEPYPWPGPDRRAAPLHDPGGRPVFLFFGALAGLGSRSGLHFMLEEVYPILRQQWGSRGFEIRIAGRGQLPAWVEATLADKPEVVRLGFVEDLATLFATCHAALFPIAAPVGNRSRILTALAHGLPVIAHESCALGNKDLVDGETALLAHDAAGFAERAARIVRDPAYALALGARGRAMYDALFHPDAAGSRLAARVRELIATRQPQGVTS